MAKKLFIKTMGCQMNEYDSDKMADVLRESHGYEITADPNAADLLLVNTCSFIHDAREESIAAIREEVVEGAVHQHIPPGSLEEMLDAEGLSNALDAEFGVRADVARWIRDDSTLTAEAEALKVKIESSESERVE